MYLEFFKFKQDPFDITPDPAFLFLSPSHKEASASIFYGIQTRKGFVAVTGEVGVGKTTILRSYLEGTDPERVRIVYVFNSTLSFDKLLKQICSDLGIQAAGEDPDELVLLLFKYLIDEYRQDRNVVLIIDEAQNMPVETLERLRMLSNLETSQDKLIQLILVGQPEFDSKLDLPELRQLKQRIAIRSRIESLTAEESSAYIQHRLMVASSFHNPVFTKKAMKLIIQEANGIPRAINILCDNALVTAFGYLRKPVDEKIVKEVIRDFRGKKRRSGFRWKFMWIPAAAACIAAAVFVSANVIAPFKAAPINKQTVRTKLSDPAPAALRIKQSATSAAARPKKAPAKTAAKSDQTPAAVTTKQSVTSASMKKKAPVAAPAAVKAKQSATSAAAGQNKASVKIAAKPDKAPAVNVEASSPKTAPKSNGAAVGVTPPVAGSSRPKAALPVANSSKAKAAPPALTSAAGDTSKSVTKKKSLPNTVVVRRGDNVTNLLRGVYGRVDDQMLRSFKNLNPQVKNINRIWVGEKILLPQLGGAKP